jgi:hypothetical protein
MSSKTYIIAWDKALDNCLEIDRQLSEAKIKYTFFNVSSDKTERPNWELSEDVRYYGHFYNALRDFVTSGKKVFGFNAGDPAHPDYPSIIKKAESVLIEPGIYAPNMEGDFLSEDGVYLEPSKRYPGLYLATQTNGMCVYMHADIASMMFDFMSWMKFKGVDFSTMVSGWGLDTAYCLMAMYTNAPIYRDGDIYIDHPPGSIYQSNAAGREMLFIEKQFIEYVDTQRGWDAEVIKEMKSTMFLKARRRKKQALRVVDMYPNLDGDLE